jgi:hypothetical protein
LFVCRWLKNEEAAKKAEFTTGPKLDLGFKEGQTIKINIQVNYSINHKNLKFLDQIFETKLQPNLII